MPKNYKEMMDEIINKMDEGLVKPSDEKKLYMRYKKMGMSDEAAREAAAAAVNEDAPANSAGSGGIAGIGVGPDGEPGVKKKKDDDKKDPLLFGKYKTFKRKIKENSDNNNIILKQVLDSIDKVEVKIDEMNGVKSEVVIEDKPEYKTFKNKYKV